jgi:hypothetical protein
MAKIKGETVLAALAGIAILYMIYHYSKSKSVAGMTSGTALGGEPVGVFSDDAGAVSQRPAETPDSLLPRDNNKSWQNNNSGAGALNGINMLKSGDLIGINTIGNTLKNANLQLRSEWVIPKGQVGPWNQSSYEADPFRKPFEIGACDK